MTQEDTQDLWQSDQPSTTPFEYEALDEQTRTFVLQKTAETHGHFHRSAQAVVKIGHNLQAVKERLPHGHFMAWIQAEFGMTYQTALNYIRVAERFGGKGKTVLTLPSKVLYLLAQPSTSDAVIAQVEAGTLAPSIEAIKAAKEAEREALAEAERQKEMASLWQQQLATTQQEAQQKMTTLNQQIEALQRAASRRAEPAAREESIPPATRAELETLRQRVTTLTTQRDALSKQAEELAAQAQERFLHADEEPQGGEHMRRHWRTTIQEAQHLLSRLLLQWPSSLDAYHFEKQDWRKLEQIEEQVQHVQSACLRLREAVERTVVAQPTPGTQGDRTT